MLLPDVNILVAAYVADSPVKVARRDWLERVLMSGEPFGISELVLSAFLRIARNPRLSREDPATALRFAQALIAAPGCVRLRPGPENWSIFETLCHQTRYQGSAISDLYHAALAIEYDCDWVSDDADFGRIPGLRWRKLPG